MTPRGTVWTWLIQPETSVLRPPEFKRISLGTVKEPTSSAFAISSHHLALSMVSTCGLHQRQLSLPRLKSSHCWRFSS